MPPITTSRFYFVFFEKFAITKIGISRHQTLIPPAKKFATETFNCKLNFFWLNLAGCLTNFLGRLNLLHQATPQLQMQVTTLDTTMVSSCLGRSGSRRGGRVENIPCLLVPPTTGKFVRSPFTHTHTLTHTHTHTLHMKFSLNLRVFRNLQ